MNNPFDGTELDPESELYPKQIKNVVGNDDTEKPESVILDTISEKSPSYLGYYTQNGIAAGFASGWYSKRGPSAGPAGYMAMMAGYNFTQVTRLTETNTVSNTNSQSIAELADVTKKGSINK